VSRFSRHLPFRPRKAVEAQELVIEELLLGDGDEAWPGRPVRLRLVGRLSTGPALEDTVVEVPLGEGQILPGIERAVRGMRVGGQRRATIPPRLGWGQRGDPGRVPPGATVVYDITLEAVR
jgi:FKBP-type peptidyl-prolyl cis-trans isomerase